MYNEAIKNYEKGLQINPWLGELYYNIGVTLHNKGIIGPTLGYFLKAERFTDTPDLPFYIGSLYLKKNDYDEAIFYFEKAIKYQFKKKDMLPLQLQLGRIYLAVKDYKNAERTFTEAIEVKKDNAEAYYYLAMVYLDQGKKELAIKTLQMVVEIAPDSKEAGYAKTMLNKIELEK